MTRQLITRLGLLVALSCSTAVLAREQTHTTAASETALGMTITGDHELPQVLYIIPWQEQLAGMPAPPTMKNPIQQPLTPCDIGQKLSNYQAELWNCPPKKTP
jgi:hypothetical protein